MKTRLHLHSPDRPGATARGFLTCLALLLALATSALHAQVPQLLNYQGRVAVGATNFNGTGQFKFALVNTNGGTTYWSNNNTSVAGSQPTAFVTLTVTNGLYSVLLGDTSPPLSMSAIPASVWTNADVRLRVWFNDGTNGFQLLTPDQRIAPNGYLPDGSVSAAAISTGAITSAKIAIGAVTSTQLAAGAVQLSNITNGAVDNTKLANSTVTVTAGSGLGGGGSVALGQSITLTNAGVRSLAAAAGSGITVDTATGTITLGSTATTSNTANAIVKRDASGNIPGTFSGNGAALTDLNAANITTGSLALPANGLTVGSTQLVANNGGVGIGTASPSAGLHVSSAGGDGTPQAWINQSNTGDYSRVRLTVGGNPSERWDIAVRNDVFVIYSNHYNREVLRIDEKGIKAVGGLVIETRTAAQGDPLAPVSGQIWLRTDL